MNKRAHHVGLAVIFASVSSVYAVSNTLGSSFADFTWTNVTLDVSPTACVIHVAEPVTISMWLSNTSPAQAKGLFLFRGDYDGFSIGVSSTEEGQFECFHDLDMYRGMFRDMAFDPVTMEPGEALAGKRVILYDLIAKEYVFGAPGNYHVRVRVRLTNRGSDEVFSPLAHITVLPWDEKNDTTNILAMKLWMDAELARAYQDGDPMSEQTSNVVHRLVNEYPGTVYGRLASELVRKGPDATKTK